MTINSTLPQNSYKERKTVGYIGQDRKAILRPVDLTDSFDISRMIEIEGVKDQSGYFPKNPSLAEWISGTTSNLSLLFDDENSLVDRNKGVLIGVAGNEDLEKEQLKGELIGWIYLYPTMRGEKEFIFEDELVPREKQHQNMWWVSYVRHQDAPKGAMGNALVQICARISQENAAFHEKQRIMKYNTFRRELRQSSKIKGLKQEEEFQEQTTWERQFAYPNFLLLAAIHPSNIASLKMAEKAGFAFGGRLPTKPNEVSEFLYYLDWRGLHKRLIKDAYQEKLGESKEIVFV